MTSIKRVQAAARQRFLRLRNRKPFEEVFLQRLPERLRPAARLVFLRDFTPEEARIADRIESFRKEIAVVAGGDKLRSFASPRSGTFEIDDENHALPGPFVASTVDSVSRTGADKINGILLRRLIDGLGAEVVLELGTNTGFSGCYFLSASATESLITVEGSADLCAIADMNLKRFGSSFRIMNRLFDDALDQLQAEGTTVDCVFIDGQHERQATWHYVEKVMPILTPGGSIIFDDIYWSDDMNRMWQEVSTSDLFSTTVDLRYKGLAVRSIRSGEKTHHDICEYLGRPVVSRPIW